MTTTEFLKAVLAKATEEKNVSVVLLCEKAIAGDPEALNTVGALAAEALGGFNIGDNAFLNFSISLNSNERVFAACYLQNLFSPKRIKLPLKNAKVCIAGRMLPCDGSMVALDDSSALSAVHTAGDLFGLEIICGETREDIDIRVYGNSAYRTGCLNHVDDVKMFYLDEHA